MTWVARGADDGRLPFGGRVSIRTATTRRSPEALLVGNRAAAPFLRRYAVILAVFCCVLLISNIAATKIIGFGPIVTDGGVRDSAAGSDVELSREEWYRVLTAAGHTVP